MTLEKYLAEKYQTGTKYAFAPPEGASHMDRVECLMMDQMGGGNNEDFKFIPGKRISDSELSIEIRKYFESQEDCTDVQEDSIGIKFQRDETRYRINMSNFSPEEVLISIVDVF